jgi:hypothetical protein
VSRLQVDAIATAVQTCECVPDQWEGRLKDGKYFYFRYRHGRASLAIGPTPRSVAGVTFAQEAGVASYEIEHGDRLRGMFNDDAEREQVFSHLLGEIQRMRAQRIVDTAT